MERNRWQQIEELYHAAMERAPNERAAFLADACADDSGLRREVEELLRYDGAAESFIEGNALTMKARQLEAEDLSTTAAWKEADPDLPILMEAKREDEKR